MKTLYFEGAGWPETEKKYGLNCRIRTALTNDKGRKIYLELMAGKKDKKRMKEYEFAGIPDIYTIVDSCHYITDDYKVDDCNVSRIRGENDEELEHNFNWMPYTLDNILNFINVNLDCSFDKVEVLPEYAGYRVFGDSKKYGTYAGYNYGDEFQYDPELTTKITGKVEELKKHFSELFNQKYDNTSYWRDGNDLHYRINVSEQRRKAAGYEEREGVIKFD